MCQTVSRLCPLGGAVPAGCAKCDLTRPPIRPRASSGALRGEVSRLDRLSENDRRAVFDEWCRVVGTDAPHESRQFDGGIRLTAAFTRPTNRGEVQGSLVLDIDPALDDEDREEARRD